MTTTTAPRAPIVLFDLDDTLMAHREAVMLAIERHMHLRAYTGEPRAAQRLWHELEEQHYHRYLAGEVSFDGQRRARARDFAAAHSEELDDAGASAWFDAYFAEYRASWALFDDALPTLDAIEAALPGARLGIITNGELGYQTIKLERLELIPRFEHIVASGAIGATKPDARIFDAALARFGEPDATHDSPESHERDVPRAAYVGDRLHTDAIGAARAGLLGVWLNRTGETPNTDDRAAATANGVLEIGTLSELPELLVTHLGRRAHVGNISATSALT